MKIHENPLCSKALLLFYLTQASSVYFYYYLWILWATFLEPSKIIQIDTENDLPLAFMTAINKQ